MSQKVDIKTQPYFACKSRSRGEHLPRRLETKIMNLINIKSRVRKATSKVWVRIALSCRSSATSVRDVNLFIFIFKKYHKHAFKYHQLDAVESRT